MQRERGIVSLAHAKMLRPTDERIGQLRKRSVRSSNDAAELLRRMVPGLGVQLRQSGDKRLAAPEYSAHDFMSTLADQLPNLSGWPNPVDGLIAHFGLNPKDIPDEMSLADMAYLAVFREQMRVVERHMNLPSGVLNELKPGHLPSWRIQHALRQRRNKAARQSGGDLADAYLATSVWYFDWTVVDRRTHEYLRQIRDREGGLQMPMHNWVKLSRYDELPSKLSETGV